MLLQGDVFFLRRWYKHKFEASPKRFLFPANYEPEPDVADAVYTCAKEPEI